MMVRTQTSAQRTNRIRTGTAQRARQVWRVCRIALPSIGLIGVASACTNMPELSFPEPLRQPKAVPTEDGAAQDAIDGIRVEPTPGVVIQRTILDARADELGKELAGEPITVSFHDVPLVAFINEVFAEQLGLAFHIGQSLQGRTDLVTLKLTEPIPPGKLFAAARMVLQEYGIEIVDKAGVLSFVAQADFSGEVPLIISGRAQPEVPVTHRTVFQFVPIKVADPGNVNAMLSRIFHRDELDANLLGGRLLLRGTGSVVAQAVDVVDVLDQPLLRGRYGAIIAPALLKVDELATDLGRVLGAEGYSASTDIHSGGGVVLLPMPNIDKLVVFAWDQSTLDHVEQWAALLDEQQRDEAAEGIFSYQVRNAQAESLAEVLGGLLDEGQLIVDKNRNTLLFRGARDQWGQLLPVVREMDVPVPSVLIEVLIAEVTLSDETQSGIDFLFNSAVRRFGLRGGTRVSPTSSNFGLEARALSLVLDRAGQTRSMLSAFYQDSKAVIRSRPRLVVKSGETASLEVGNEIPTITQTATGNENVIGPINTVQQVQYRRTGVALMITPIVQANGLVDLEAELTVSEVRNTTAENRLTPTILNRTLSTSLTLRDGGSLLMGGLISDNRSDGQTGVPGLAKLPGLGRLFRVDTGQRDTTEMVLMVIPYVIADHAEGQALTERIKAALTLHGRPSSAFATRALRRRECGVCEPLPTCRGP